MSDMTTNSNVNSRQNFFAIKGHYWNNWQNLNVICRLDDSNISMLTYWFSGLYCVGKCLIVENKVFGIMGHLAGNSLLKAPELKN